MRARWAALVLAAVLAGMPASARGQVPDTLSPAARQVMRQPVGTVLRLHANNQQITGVFERVDAGTLYLSDPPRTLALRSIDEAWLQQRSTGRGAKVGAIIGAAGGATLFTFGALVLSGLDSGIDGTGDIALAGLFGAALGGGSGFLVGALIGAGIPRWERIGDATAPPVIAREGVPRRGRLSSFTVMPAASRAAEGGGVGAGASLTYLTQLTRNFALGPEFGVYALDAPTFTSDPCGEPQPCPYSIEPDGGAWTAGGLARIGAGAGVGLEPYALLGFGLYRFPYGQSLGGYSAGGGLRYRRSTTSLAFSGEARYHSNLTNSGDEMNLGFVTLGIGISLLR